MTKNRLITYQIQYLHRNDGYVVAMCQDHPWEVLSKIAAIELIKLLIASGGHPKNSADWKIVASNGDITYLGTQFPH